MPTSVSTDFLESLKQRDPVFIKVDQLKTFNKQPSRRKENNVETGEESSRDVAV
jgi:hypothetical protein